MKILHGLALACGLLAALAGRAGASVTIDRVEYHGWQGAYRMSNGTVELVVVPQIGRIMRYAFVGGPNALWENPELRGKLPDTSNPSGDWINYGGDKLWNAPQERWDWPPDPAIDRGAYTVTQLAGGRLRLTGQASAKWGLRFEREITLAQRGAGITLRNTLTNVGAKSAEWAIWEVAQIDDPAEVRLPRSRTGRFKPGYLLFPKYTLLPGMLSVSDSLVALRRSPKQSAKIGSDSPDGWILGVFASRNAAQGAGQEFKLSATVEPGRRYADDGCPEQTFVMGDPLKYAEMEMLGPLRDIRPGGSVTLVTHWELRRGKR